MSDRWDSRRGMYRIGCPILAMGWALVIALCSSSVAAEEDSDDEYGDSDVTVRTVERSSLQRDDARFASGMATRVDTEELEFRAQTLDDSLAQVVGVNVRRDSSSGQPAHISVRGGNARQTAVELDGLRLNAPVGMGFDAGRMMGAGIGSVDVYRGSAAAIYGGGAVTGAMRLNPASPPQEGWELRARTLAGSFGTTTMSAVAGTGDGQRGLRVYGAARQSNGDFEFVDDQNTSYRRLNNDHQRLGLGATGQLEQGDHRLRITGMWEGGQAGSAGPSEFQASFQHARTDDQRALATLRWDRRGLLDRSQMAVDGHLTAGAQQRHINYRNEQSLFSREPFETDATQRTVALTGGLAAWIGSSHLARIDGETRFETYEGHELSTQEQSLRAFRRTGRMSVADEWLLAGDRLSLIAAVRAEISDRNGGDGIDGEPFLPAVGAIARLDERLEVRANLARTFRNPDFDELYLRTDGMRGNPDLAPERAWTSDLGLGVGADDDPLRVQLAGFYHAIDATILFLPVSAYLFEAQNLHGATSRGIEAAAQFQPTRRWELSTQYTHTRARLARQQDGQAPQLPGQPRHRAAMESTVDLTGPGHDTLPKLAWLSSANYRSSVHLDNFGNLQNPAALRLDMGLIASFSDRFRTGLYVHNLLDHRRAQDSLHRPLPGRAFYISMELRGEGS